MRVQSGICAGRRGGAGSIRRGWCLPGGFRSRSTWRAIAWPICFWIRFPTTPTRPRATHYGSGLPVLTCRGDAFAGRVAASLLQAVGLPELIVSNLEEYEALALKLARDPALLAEIKAKLARNRDTYPLFDTAPLHPPYRSRLHGDVGDMAARRITEELHRRAESVKRGER